MTRTLEEARQWAEQGTGLVRDALAKLGADDAVLSEPSALPGWTRKHLLAHIAANADALVNLTVWARTGVETPMYSSPAQRNADIEAGATMNAGDLLAWFERSASKLAEGWQSLSPEQWDAQVVTAQGRTVPVSETPWMRTREVMVHAIDLDAGVRFAELPADFCAALIADIVEKRSKGGNPALVIAPSDAHQRWQVAGEGASTEVSGPLAELTAWLAGRPASGLATADGQPVPELPAWL